MGGSKGGQQTQRQTFGVALAGVMATRKAERKVSAYIKAKPWTEA